MKHFEIAIAYQQKIKTRREILEVEHFDHLIYAFNLTFVPPLLQFVYYECILTPYTVPCSQEEGDENDLVLLFNFQFSHLDLLCP